MLSEVVAIAAIVQDVRRLKINLTWVQLYVCKMFCALQGRQVLKQCLFWCSYQGARSSEAFLAFLHEKLDSDRGFARVEALDKLASAFLTAADKSGAAAAIKAAAEKLGEAEQTAGALYAKFAEKASSKVAFADFH
jgi:hypothetical protein